METSDASPGTPPPEGTDALLARAVRESRIAAFALDEDGHPLAFQGLLAHAVGADTFFRRADVVAAVHDMFHGAAGPKVIPLGPLKVELAVQRSTSPGARASGILIDVTGRERRMAELRGELSRSPITGLRNRSAMTADLDATIEMAASARGAVCTIVILIDRFDQVLESFGFANASATLREVAQRLYAIDAPGVEIGSLELGKFVVFAGIGASGLPDLIADVEAAFQHPVAAESDRILIRPVIGAAVYPEHGEHAEMLIQNAERAARAAGGRGEGHGVHVASNVHPRRNFALLSELRAALGEQSLRLEYQPLIDLRSLEVDSVEALVRWDHPLMGRIAPDEFIPIAERSGMIGEVTQFVLDQAARQAGLWDKVGVAPRIAVNVAPEDLRHPEFAARLDSALRQTGLPLSTFTVEVTERTDLGLLTGTALQQLTTLVDRGLEIAIDDFGTGFSNIGSLHQLPCAQIKIDRSFVSQVAEGEHGQRVVGAMIQLGHSLDRVVVAEGVETLEQWHILRNMGCDLVQGYYISPPMVPRDLPEFLARAPWR